MEFEGSKDRVGLLVLGGAQVEVVLGGLALGLQVGEAPEHENGVSEEDPADGSCWVSEQLGHVKEAICTSSGHKVNKQKGVRGSSLQVVIGSLGICEAVHILSVIIFVVGARSMDVGIRENLLGVVVQFENLVDVALDGIDLGVGVH